MPYSRRQTHNRKKVHFRLKRRVGQTRHRFLGIILLVLGLTLLAFPTTYQKITNRPVSVSQVLADFGPIQIDKRLLGQSHAQPLPLRIIIPSVKIDLAVKEARVVNGFWEVFEETAGHGAGSANPGSVGNAVIFAHARQGQFLTLREVKKSTLIYVLTENRWHRYQVTEIKEVRPQQIEVIAPTETEVLTLFTCSGFFDSQRLVVVARPT